MPGGAECADNFGLKRQLRSIFRVKIACGRKQYHSFDGYLGLSVQRHVIKFSLDV